MTGKTWWLGGIAIALTAIIVVAFLFHGWQRDEVAPSQHAGHAPIESAARGALSGESLQVNATGVATAAPEDGATGPADDSLGQEALDSGKDEVDNSESVSAPRSEREKQLVAKLGLKKAHITAATELMRKYSSEELDLLARIQRKAKRWAPQEVLDIIQKRRDGASYETVVAESKDTLPEDLMVRLILLKWLREQYGHDTPVQTGPTLGPRVGGRLQRK